MGFEFEELVTKELKGAIITVIKERLGGYGSPMSKMVDEVVLQNTSLIKDLLRESITESFSKEEFRNEIKSAFAHTLARSLMADYKGEIEKQANALRQQPDFRARVILAIENLVNESMQ